MNEQCIVFMAMYLFFEIKYVTSINMVLASMKTIIMLTFGICSHFNKLGMKNDRHFAHTGGQWIPLTKGH